MANMNFGVNILPKANNTYTLGNSDYKWNIFANTLNGISLTNIITDIQIDGNSIINNNIATIPIATTSTLGLIKVGTGLYISNGTLFTNSATDVQIKAASSIYVPIVPANQHTSTFYGLAKAAGDSTQAASSNAVGTYTDGAKTAIQSMLGLDNKYVIQTNPRMSGRVVIGEHNAESFITSNHAALSLAYGYYSTPAGDGSIALGYDSAAIGTFSTAGGNSSVTYSGTSLAYGIYTSTAYAGQATFGRFNINEGANIPYWTSGTSYNVGDIVYYQVYVLKCITAHTASGTSPDYSYWDEELGKLLVIGNGLNSNNRSNALAVFGTGNVAIKGDLYINCNNDSTGGSKVATEAALNTLSSTIPTAVSQLTNDSGYTTNTGTITGITMNGSSKGTSGVIDLGTIITTHQDISGKTDLNIIAEPYDSTEIYAKDRWITYNGKLYKCNYVDPFQGGEWDSSKWTEQNIGDNLENIGYRFDSLVVGTGSGTHANHVVLFNGDTGKEIKDSGFTIGTSVPANAIFTDTTYTDATTSASGLMSAADKTKLNGIATGATANIGTITGITMNGISKGTSGVVDLGTVITSHQDISGKVNKTGDTMTGTLYLKSDSAIGINTQNSSGQTITAIRGVYNSGTPYVQFVSYKPGDTSIYENYTLPAFSATSAKGYSILTSKNVVTVPQGGTGATDAATARANLGVVNKAGDTMTGNLTINQASGSIGVFCNNTTSTLQVRLQIGSGGINHGIYSNGYVDSSNVFHSSGQWLIYRNSSGNILVNGQATNDLHYGEYVSPNFNTILTAGAYGIQGGSPTNCPDGLTASEKYGHLLVMEYRRSSSNYYCQIYFAHGGTNRIFERISTADASSWNAWTEITYSSKSAASGGTDVSLVTTGEKYTWNNKSNLTIGTTSTTAAAGNHSHTVSIAADSGTNQLTMAASTKYKLTVAGGTYIFTTPPNTTYSSKAAASGGTDVSLVTTGEKYTWNNKTSNTGTVTSVTLTQGAGITVSSSGTAITTSGTRTISISGMDTSSGSTTKCLTQKGTWASFTNNAGTVTSIKMNGSSKSPSSGVVDLGTVITAHQDISHVSKIKRSVHITSSNKTASLTLEAGHHALLGIASGFACFFSANGTLYNTTLPSGFTATLSGDTLTITRSSTTTFMINGIVV